LESLLSIEVSLTHRSKEDAKNFVASIISFTDCNKPIKITPPTSELVVNLNVDHEEHLLRELADTGTSSSKVLESYA
jgi:predicted transcriptional regulator